jgi:two-component system phosphate regulon sensor histidine kinase PhoR
MSDLQKDFINNMTHEFKTPLSSIQVSAEVFLNDHSVVNSPRLIRYAKIIKEQSNRLNDQVERVLQIADLQKGQIVLNSQIFALDDLVTSVIGQLKGRAEKEDAEIKAHYLGTNFLIKADRHHLSNVLYNLTDNSLKYRKGPVSIIMIVEEGAKNLTLTVRDNGIGVDQIYLQKLDQKFFRVPTGNVHNTKGFGLGLHYVKRIVKAHRWTMQINSQIDQGTQISIKIPKSPS